MIETYPRWRSGSDRTVHGGRAMAVATKSVTGRRQLHFDTLDDVLADVEQLNRGQIKNLGNWSPGQVLKHLTILMTGSLDGFHHRAPWFIRLVGKVVKK